MKLWPLSVPTAWRYQNQQFSLGAALQRIFLKKLMIYDDEVAAGDDGSEKFQQENRSLEESWERDLFTVKGTQRHSKFNAV